MEDAPKRPDKLTRDEARTAVAQNSNAAHIVYERARVTDVDDRVGKVDDRVAGIHALHFIVDTGHSVFDARMASVDDRVKLVDDTVADVIHDGKAARQVMKQIPNDVDQIVRSVVYSNSELQ
ncbi:hypothetical protein DFH94DRAFT_688022 [Russula ochroleuca]|uniref:Uncharacterized protein n=1 Tax=Russula ochroleuca TaxID=152965 RepID=A0A9P5N693_9AGAM|nr:hypothetical protein DFH94DRAFT_688022 [Russula ochroleuca]